MHRLAHDLVRKQAAYKFEDLREFFMRRPWLRGGEFLPGGHGRSRDWAQYREICNYVISELEFTTLKNRESGLGMSRVRYLRAFIDGWTMAKR